MYVTLPWPSLCSVVAMSVDSHGSLGNTRSLTTSSNGLPTDGPLFQLAAVEGAVGFFLFWIKKKVRPNMSAAPTTPPTTPPTIAPVKKAIFETLLILTRTVHFWATFVGNRLFLSAHACERYPKSLSERICNIFSETVDVTKRSLYQYLKSRPCC